MSVFWFGRDEVAEPFEEKGDVERYHQVLSVALDLELHIVHQIDSPNTPLEQVYVFVLDVEQTWRISAYMGSKDLEGPWTDGLEQFQSMLLGYSRSQFATWIAKSRWRIAAWGARTFFALIPATSMPYLANLGMKAFSPDAVMDPLRVFAVREDLLVRRDAAALLPPDTVLVRFGLKHEAQRAIKNQTEHQGLLFGDLPRADLAEINRALRSEIQVLESSGWR